jgi:hypothetical protein
LTLSSTACVDLQIGVSKNFKNQISIMETLTRTRRRTTTSATSRRQNTTTITLSYNAQNALLNSIIQAALLAGAKQVPQSIPYGDIEKTSPYDPVFVAEIEKSRREVAEGKFYKLDNIDDLWK